MAPSRHDLDQAITELRRLNDEYADALRAPLDRLGDAWVGGGSAAFGEELHRRRIDINRRIDAAIAAAVRLRDRTR